MAAVARVELARPMMTKHSIIPKHQTTFLCLLNRSPRRRKTREIYRLCTILLTRVLQALPALLMQLLGRLPGGCRYCWMTMKRTNMRKKMKQRAKYYLQMKRYNANG